MYSYSVTGKPLLVFALTGPISGGVHGRPFARPLVDLDAHGYVEEEYLLEGEAERYRLVGEMTRDGRWEAQPTGAAPFRTRVVVYRPTEADRFNGAAIVSWNNVTAGYDLFGGESPEILESGYAYIGVTTQKAGIEGLDPMRQGLRDWHPERYGSLHHPGDDHSFDIYTQAAAAVRDEILPSAGFAVRHLIAMGASQSAGRLATYINAIHTHANVFDAYLPTIWFGAGTALEVGDAVVNINVARPTVDRRQLLRGSHQIRDDLGVKTFVVNSELEAIACFDIRQPDTDTFRYWEAAGTCHVSAQSMATRGPKYERDFGTVLPVTPGINRIPLMPLYDAALHHLHRWLTEGTPPPEQPKIEFEGDPPAIVRDEHGIARGGIRLPQVEVPIAQNSAIPLADDIYSILYGSSVPFPKDQVLAMYGDRDAYLDRFEEAARTAEKAGVLLPRDVRPEEHRWLAAGKRPPVLVNVNGHEYRNTVAVMSGKYMIGISAAIRKATGLKAADPITVTLTVTDSRREVNMPEATVGLTDPTSPTRRQYWMSSA